MSMIPAVISSRKGRESETLAFAESMVASVDSLIAGKNAATALPLFVGYNTTTPVTARNSSAWCSGISDITCISNWNSNGLYQKGGVLISPIHGIFANHFPMNNGDTLNFVTMSGTLVQRTIASQTRIGTTDLVVFKLLSDVPESIGFAKVLPLRIYDDFSRLVLGGTIKIPAIRMDAEEKALVGDTLSEYTSTEFTQPVNSKRLEFYENLAEGDSGNPAFWIYDNQLLLATVFHFGGGGSGDSVNFNRAAVNAAMQSLGGGYQLTEISPI